MADGYLFSEETYILLGKIAKPHGLKGEVRIHAFSDEPGSLLNYKEIVLVDKNGRYSPVIAVEKARLQGKTAVYKLGGVDDRNSAESLLGRGVLLDKSTLPAALKGEYYWFQFEGLPVHTESGRNLGLIQSVFSNGAQDVLVVHDGDAEYLIPVHSTIIVEHSKNGVVIAPPPGLLEINTLNDASEGEASDDI